MNLAKNSVLVDRLNRPWKLVDYLANPIEGLFVKLDCMVDAELEDCLIKFEDFELHFIPVIAPELLDTILMLNFCFYDLEPYWSESQG